MKIALVCIAKNEENYIKEWVTYHKKLGFDDIFIYQNDWRWDDEIENVHKLIMDGVNKQRSAYNHFITNFTDYNWAAFFDVDEFLVLKQHKTIKEFIGEYSDYNAIGINWVLFGNNGHENFDGNYSVINRFTMRQKDVNEHIKSIVKLDKHVIMDVHNPNCSWVNTNKELCTGPFNFNKLDDVAQINHYFCKSRLEFQLKCSRGRADSDIYKRDISEYDTHNLNEVNDFHAYNLYNN